MADTDSAVTVSVESLTAFIVSVLEALKMLTRNATCCRPSTTLRTPIGQERV